MVFVEALSSPDEMKAVNKALAALHTPSMANMIEGGRTPFLSAKELEALGYSVVVYPCASVFTAVKALREWATHLKQHGTTADFLSHMVTFDEYFEFIGASAIREREKTFLAESTEASVR
jgi:methylisocitrate lyase